MRRVEIARLGHLGDGVAPGPLFVPGALPGETVAGTPEGNRLRDVKILTPAPERVKPPCRHVPACGGCTMQHASERFLAGWKLQLVRDALAAQGLTAEVAMLSVSPPASRRRATLAGRRSRKGAIVGFHRKGAAEIVEIPDCRLLHGDLMAALPALRALTLAGASRKGVLALSLTRSEAGPDVAVSGGKAADPALAARLAAIARAHDLARLAWNGEVIAQRRPPLQRMGRAQVMPPPGAFLQATEAGEAALVRTVREITAGARRVADLFSGCGTFALPLAEAAQVHAVEGDAAMLSALDRGWRHAEGLRQITTEARDLFRRPLLAAELARVDALVIDPPRAGAEAQMAEIARSPIATVASVSCNPASFARDARILTEAGFALSGVGVVDQFRWSAHVELVGAFRR